MRVPYEVEKQAIFKWKEIVRASSEDGAVEAAEETPEADNAKQIVKLMSEGKYDVEIVSVEKCDEEE